MTVDFHAFFSGVQLWAAAAKVSSCSKKKLFPPLHWDAGTIDMLSNVGTCDITISMSSKQHLCLTLEGVWHMERVVSVITISWRTSWNKRGLVQKHLFRTRYCIISKIAKVFFICCLTRQSHCHWDSYLVKVEFCAVMSDTNMLTTSCSRLIIFLWCGASFVLEVLPNVI